MTNSCCLSRHTPRNPVKGCRKGNVRSYQNACERNLAVRDTAKSCSRDKAMLTAYAQVRRLGSSAIMLFVLMQIWALLSYRRRMVHQTTRLLPSCVAVWPCHERFPASQNTPWAAENLRANSKPARVEIHGSLGSNIHSSNADWNEDALGSSQQVPEFYRMTAMKRNIDDSYTVR